MHILISDTHRCIRVGEIVASCRRYCKLWPLIISRWLLFLLLLDAFRSTDIYHCDILSGSRRFVVLSQVILINFQASLLASTLFTYLRDAIIIITKLFPVVVVIIVIVIVFFITSIGNTLSRRTSLINQRLALLDFQGTHFA
jgi:hypothetical protein